MPAQEQQRPQRQQRSEHGCTGGHDKSGSAR